MRERLPWRVGLVLVIVPLLAACATGAAQAPARIVAFSTATQLAMDNTTTAFQTVEARHTEMLVTRLSVNYDKQPFNPSMVKPFLSPEALQARQQTFGGLKRYAELLSSVVSDQVLDQYDASTIGLGNALARLDKDLVAKNYLNARVVGDQGIDIFTTAINALGRFIIERKRDRGLRETVKEMDPTVKEIVRLVRLDIGESPEKPGLRNELWNTYDSTIAAQDSFIRNALGAGTMDPIAARTEVRTLVVLVSDQRNADQALAATRDTLQALADAHARLSDTFDPSLTATVERLSSEGQRVKAFYDALRK
jgi:hypothetical protein